VGGRGGPEKGWVGGGGQKSGKSPHPSVSGGSVHDTELHAFHDESNKQGKGGGGPTQE